MRVFEDEPAREGRTGVDREQHRRRRHRHRHRRPHSGPPRAALVLQHPRTGVLQWEGDHWLWPLPPPGALVVARRWPDRGIEETTVTVDTAPLPAAAGCSASVWARP